MNNVLSKAGTASYSAVQFLSGLSGLLAHGEVIQVLNLRNLSDNVWSVFFFGSLTVDGVADQDDVLDVRQLCKFANFFPVLDFVVRRKEHLQLDAWCKTFESLDQVVRNPQLLQGLPDLIEANNSPDVVAAERQNLYLSEFGQVDHLVDAVG